ncbi:hypothetical protein [Maribacter sp. MAR_2009_72]|uniref:hypothetical protein n=1 Tax=Maribacter sp. MAR_2009_72 TaxID=1250050 RepID=UPI00119BDD7D|nr:hypothetical protein [Maribacter sp. MAR_2009_72]TVZ15698.1 hypothetical protein JM81_1950 [Maribacter sp. MAR_2009_72]
MNKFLPVLIIAASVLISCTNYGQLKVVTDLPSSLEEISGMVTYNDSTIWAIEDNGNKDEIYQVDQKGKILKSLKVKNGDNTDWEDLTKDKDGNLYIADIGNNANTRKNLVIYKVPNPSQEPGEKIDAEQIAFYYPEQKKFPPNRNALFYDAEAIFHKNNKLFIVTKNRSNPFTGEAFIYTVPDSKGTYEASLIGTFTPCKDWKLCQITAIDISPNGEKIVALSYGKLFVFTNFTWDDFSNGKMEEIDLGARTQLESICFIDNKTILLADERSHGTGGNLYTYTLP